MPCPVLLSVAVAARAAATGQPDIGDVGRVDLKKSHLSIGAQHRPLWSGQAVSRAAEHLGIGETAVQQVMCTRLARLGAEDDGLPRLLREAGGGAIQFAGAPYVPDQPLNAGLIAASRSGNADMANAAIVGYGFTAKAKHFVLLDNQGYLTVLNYSGSAFTLAGKVQVATGLSAMPAGSSLQLAGFIGQ